MQLDPNDRPLRFDDEEIKRFRDVLAAADYSDAGIAKALGLRTARAISEHDPALLLLITGGGRRLDTLIRLLMMGETVAFEMARPAVAPMDVEEWVRSGLLEHDGDGVRSTVELLPFQNLILAFDFSRRAMLRADYVMGIGSSSLTLANLTVRRPAGWSLDLGAGCGFQAFLAARHSERVIATDLNPRAAHLANFNARFNGLANVEVRLGPLFEPVADCRFDLVVSNPPFVISPELAHIYRDGGMIGDEIVRTLLRQAPRVLSEGGFCQVFCNWAHLAGEDWHDRLAGWFEDSGCDAWVMRTDTLEANAYAAKWIRHTERDSPEQFARRYEQWTAYYAKHGIEAVSDGAIVLRRRSGKNWRLIEEGPENMLGPAGDALLRGFECRDFLEATSDDRALLASRLRVSPDCRLRQEFEPATDGWASTRCEIQLVRGLAFRGNIDRYVADLCGFCNGQRRLDEALSMLATQVGQDAESLVGSCLAVVRRLVEHGFLVPVDPRPDV